MRPYHFPQKTFVLFYLFLLGFELFKSAVQCSSRARAGDIALLAGEKNFSVNYLLLIIRFNEKGYQKIIFTLFVYIRNSFVVNLSRLSRLPRFTASW